MWHDRVGFTNPDSQLTKTLCWQPGVIPPCKQAQSVCILLRLCWFLWLKVAVREGCMAELIRVLPGRRNSREKQRPGGLASGNSRGAETGRPGVCLEGYPGLKAGVRSQPGLLGREAVRFAVSQTGWMGRTEGDIGSRDQVLTGLAGCGSPEAECAGRKPPAQTCTTVSVHPGVQPGDSLIAECPAQAGAFRLPEGWH